MKTLDEVIKGMEHCHEDNCMECPYQFEPRDFDCITQCQYSDALFYLKEYREKHDDILRMEEALGYCEIMDNPPLTWDSLKGMVGKPVWVEILSDEIDLSSRWMMVARETKAHSLPLAYTDDMGHWIYGHEDDLGKTWQAYRKERE